ncbi:agmatine deiminase family protein [bacterium]|jgi:agmatine deiminase|nr:agmatine deiminase family protein [bacterium]
MCVRILAILTPYLGGYRLLKMDSKSHKIILNQRGMALPVPLDRQQTNGAAMRRRRFLAQSLAVCAAPALPAHAEVAGVPPGFIVPAEDTPHDATVMMWPASRQIYPNRAFRSLLQRCITEIANSIALFEPVILCADAALHSTIRPRLSAGVTLWDIPTEDLWARDAGPLIARNTAGERVLSHIQFNGWGRKQYHRYDKEVAQATAQALGFAVHDSGLVGEAGGVEQDGDGTLIAHESSWVIDNRNPGLSRDQIASRLKAAFGAERLIWSKGVKGQDITDYHIDSLARFTGPSRVLLNLPPTPDPDDPFHREAQETYDTLVSAGLAVDVIPEPSHHRKRLKLDFVASYVNFYVCNGAVIAPQFGDATTDRIAQLALQRHYPNREIVTLNTDPLGEIGGGIHCATQQIPS